MRTTLIVTTYDWPEALDLTLGSIARQSELPDEVIVADDGSGGETAALVRQWEARLGVPLLHVWQAHAGFRLARCRNLGIAAASGDYLVFVDGDMVLHPQFVADHRWAALPGCFVQGSRARSGPDAARRLLARELVAVTPLQRDIGPRYRTLRSRWLSRLFLRPHSRPRWIQGCNQAYWRRDLLRANGFDERMVRWGREDDELAARLFNAGLQRRDLRFAGLAVHIHHPSRTSVGPNLNDRYLFETRANRLTRCAAGLDQHLGRGAGTAD